MKKQLLKLARFARRSLNAVGSGGVNQCWAGTAPAGVQRISTAHFNDNHDSHHWRGSREVKQLVADPALSYQIEPDSSAQKARNLVVPCSTGMAMSW